MSNRKYPRLSDGYHDRSPYHPYQNKKQANCIADSRDRDRSPSGSNSKDNSPYFSNRHSNLSPRSQRSKFSYIRSKDGSKKGSSQSPKDSHHDSNSHLTERRTKFNHSGAGEEFPWSQHISSSGKVYYYNFKTEKSQWEKPKEWIERERKEKESKDRIRSSVSSKDGSLRKDDSTYEKSRTYASKYSSKDAVNNKRDINRVPVDDRGRENHQIAESDRGQMVIKTVSAYTSAQSTASHRSTPLAAVNSDVSPAGSLQDVSPPSTPSSRASIFDTGSHTSSPQLVSVSPHSTPYQNSQSPLGLSRHGVMLQVSSSCTVNSQQYNKPLHNMAQPLHNSTQYGLVNNGSMLTASQLKTSYDGDTNSRPVLHPLQQATLLHQKKLSESRNHAISNYQQSFHAITQTAVQPVAAALLKDRINQSPGSPIISSQNTKEQFQSLPHVQTSAPNSAQISPSSVSPVPQQPTPALNLQALAKHVDKSLINHAINWPTEAIEKQVQRLNDEGYSSSSDASKVQIQQLHLNSQLDLLDIMLNAGSKRISSMKEVTKTLEKLLAESDKKSLT